LSHFVNSLLTTVPDVITNCYTNFWQLIDYIP